MTGSEVREQRIAKGISQRLLAAYVGIDPAQISKYELGVRDPAAKYLPAIEEGLRVLPLLSHEKLQEIRESAKA